MVEPLDWIDTHSALPAGRLSVNARCTVVFVASAFILAMMAYGVLHPRVQFAVVDAIVGATGLTEELARYRPLLRIIVWSLGAFTFYFVVPALIVRVVFGMPLRAFGLTMRGFGRHLWIYTLLFIPVGGLVLMVAGTPEFQAKYPFYHSPLGWADLLIWEAFYALQFVSLEFFFRGFMLHGLKDRLGRFAIFAMIIPYAMIHFSKPMYETVGAIGAGAILGTLSLRTGSIAGGAFIHIAVAISMDLAALGHRMW